jgi:carbohydrate-selective porin OprB
LSDELFMDEAPQFGAFPSIHVHRSGSTGKTVSHRNGQEITWVHMQGRVLETVRSHEAKEFAAGGVEGVLIRETNRQNAIRAEQG